MITESEAQYEEWMDELYREHKEQAIEEFTGERLKSFYLAHPLIARPSFEALTEARKLVEGHLSAAQVIAAVAVEVGLKDALLKPVVHGLVHSTRITTLLRRARCSRLRRANVSASSFVGSGASEYSRSRHLLTTRLKWGESPNAFLSSRVGGRSAIGSRGCTPCRPTTI